MVTVTLHQIIYHSSEYYSYAPQARSLEHTQDYLFYCSMHLLYSKSACDFSAS